jgi:hypothetical protein
LAKAAVLPSCPTMLLSLEAAVVAVGKQVAVVLVDI